MESSNKNSHQTDLSENPIIKQMSYTVTVISIITVVVAAVGFIGYFSFQSTYSGKLQDRRENSMLYDDPAQKNLPGTEDLPEVEIFKQPAAAQQAQQPQSEYDQVVQQALREHKQTQFEKDKQARQGANAQETATKDSSTKPSPTPVPKDIFVNSVKTLSIKIPSGWTAGNNVLTSKDGVSTVRVFETQSTDDLETFIKNKPNSRSPATWEKKSMSGAEGHLTEIYSYDPGGSPSRSISLFFQSKRENHILSVHIDSKNLDINDTSLTKTAKEIEENIKLLEAPDED
jgi:hypothetical protein